MKEKEKHAKKVVTENKYLSCYILAFHFVCTGEEWMKKTPSKS